MRILYLYDFIVKHCKKTKTTRNIIVELKSKHLVACVGWMQHMNSLQFLTYISFYYSGYSVAIHYQIPPCRLESNRVVAEDKAAQNRYEKQIEKKKKPIA